MAARHLIALGADSIFISESLPTAEELETLGKSRDGKIVLSARLFSGNGVLRELLSHTFTAREDEARDVIRAKEGRSYVKGKIPR